MSALSWVLIALAVAAAGYRVVHVAGNAVSHDALLAVLKKLILGGDLARAKKLLSVIGPATPIANAMSAVVARVEEFPPRSDELVVRAALEKTFADEFDTRLQSVRASQFLSGIALLSSVAAIATALQVGPAPIPLVIAAGVVVLVVGYAGRAARKIAVGGPRVFQGTLPLLIARVCTPPSTYREPSDEAKTVAVAAIEGGANPTASLERQPKKDVIFIDVVRAGAETRHLELPQPVIKIGTVSTAHVSVEPEKGIGRMHAVIERTDDGALIIDLGNQGGTIVGGAKISRTKLQQGDEVIIGTTTLRIGIGLPPTYLELEPVDTDDPKSWEPAAMHLYGFDTRSPDLFYELVDEIVRASPAAKGIRLAKLRRPSGDPTFLIALLGGEAAVKVARAALEQQLESRYARCATPAAEIAPDATYGRETSTSAILRDELRAGSIEVLVTVVV